MNKCNNFMEVVEKIDVKNFIKNINEKSLLIYSPTSIKKLKLPENYNIDKISWHNISKDIENIEKYIDKNKEYEYIISLGGGSPTDIAKYIAYKMNKKFICIPTMLSTNSYSTDKVALIKNNKKVTIQAKLADSIIVDEKIIKNNSLENLYGIADILSIYTALFDWKLSNKYNNENIDIKIYNMAQKLLEDVIFFIKNKSIEEIENDISSLFIFIGTSGYITNIYGSGRPESGSEHIFAKEMESRINVKHGISVSIGILIMSIIQQRESEEVIQCIKKINVLKDLNIKGISKELIENILKHIKPREDRYSIINHFKNEDILIKEVVSKFYKYID